MQCQVLLGGALGSRQQVVHPPGVRSQAHATPQAVSCLSPKHSTRHQARLVCLHASGQQQQQQQQHPDAADDTNTSQPAAAASAAGAQPAAPHGGDTGPATAPVRDKSTAAPVKDTPDRSFRQRAQRQRRAQQDKDEEVRVPKPIPPDSRDAAPRPLNFVAGVGEPQLLPGLISFNPNAASSEPAAALQQLLAGVDDPAAQQQLLQVLEGQYDEQLLQQLQDMPPEQLQQLLQAAAAPENDIGWWEEQLLNPVMQDQLREDLGPELSELMDILLGQPPARPARAGSSTPTTDPRGKGSKRLRLRARGAAAAGSSAGSGTSGYDPSLVWEVDPREGPGALRRRLMRLTPAQQARLPELFMALEQVSQAYSTAGQLKEAYETASARQERLKYLALRRRARAQGLGEPERPQPASTPGNASGFFLGEEEEEEGEEGQGEEQGQTAGSTGSTDRGSSSRSSRSTSGMGSGSAQQAATQVTGRAAVAQAMPRPASEAAADLPGTLPQQQTGPAAGQEGAGADVAQAGGVGRQDRMEPIRQLLQERGLLDAEPAAAPSQASHNSGSGAGAAGGSSSDGGSSSNSVASNGSGSPAGSEGSLRQSALEAGLSEGMADLVDRLNALYERYNPATGSGWEEEGHAGSPEMQCLKRAALTLAGAARVTSQEELAAAGMSEAELQLHMDAAINDLTALLHMEATAGAAGLSDPALHACLLYLRTQLLQPAEGDQGTADPASAVQGQGQAPTAAQPGAPAGTAASSAAGGRPVMTLPVDRDTTDRLLRVIAASEVWEALHSLAGAWSSREQQRRENNLASTLMDMAHVGQGEHAWWAKEWEDMSDEEQRAVLRRRFDRAVAQRAAGGDGVMEPEVAARLQREEVLVPDEERIQALASLDSGVLRCLQELEEQDYAHEALMKWSLHPVVGPRLTAGLPLMDVTTVHPWFQDVLAEAQNTAAEGLEFEWRVKTRSRANRAPTRRVAAQQAGAGAAAGAAGGRRPSGPSRAKTGGSTQGRQSGLPKRVQARLAGRGGPGDEAGRGQ